MRSRWSPFVVLLTVIAAGVLLSGCGGEDAAVPEATAGTSTLIDDAEGAALIDQGDALVIDVRTTEEYADGHLVGAQNINVEDETLWEQRIEPLDRDRPTVVYCRSGRRSAVAAQLLIDAGFTQVYDLGGVEDWDSAVLAVES